jgi:hypothetical protein
LIFPLLCVAFGQYRQSEMAIVQFVHQVAKLDVVLTVSLG